MARFDDLLGEARPGLPQAPDFSIVSALRRAAGHFCRQSGIWSEQLDDFALREGHFVYDLETPMESAVERVLSLTVGGCAVRNVMRFQDMHALRRSAGGVSAYALTSDGLSLAVWQTPNADAAGKPVSVLAVLAPTRSSREIPDWMADEWHDAIVAGAKGELLSTPGMPWTNPQAAMDHRYRFDQEIARARREALSGHHTPLRVRPRPWA